MMIHIWMHWFWITTAYFKGFLLLTPTISLLCVSHPTLAEAGLLDNKTFAPTPTPAATPAPAPVPPHLSVNDSSQTGEPTPIITLVPKDNPPGGTSSPSSSPPEETPRLDSSSTSDLEDTYNGGSLDAFQYPLKKFTKYSHLKYGKTKAKGELETVKIVEEKVNINISIPGRPEEEVDKGNDSSSEGSTSEVPTSDDLDAITTTLAAEEANASNGTLKDEPEPEPEKATEDQKEVEILKNETLVIENKVEETAVRTSVEPFVVKNRVAAATSAQNYEVDQGGLNAGSITGITLGILVVFSLFGAVSFVLYRRRYLNKPQVLHDKCSNLDSSGYIDETSLRENSEEMYSLDNDSFLNSLEAMTIQNYWTENVKHTKL